MWDYYLYYIFMLYLDEYLDDDGNDVKSDMVDDMVGDEDVLEGKTDNSFNRNPVSPRGEKCPSRFFVNN